MQGTREFDPGSLGGSSAGHLPSRDLASLPFLTPHFSHGSRPEYSRMEYGAQGGLWRGQQDLGPPSCCLTSFPKNTRWSHSGSTGQGWPSTLKSQVPQSHRPYA